MPLGTELGLGPGHIVLDGNPAPRKGAQFAYALSAIFLLPVSVYAPDRASLIAFLQSLAPDIASLDHYGVV